VAESKKKNKRVSGDMLEYIQAREAADPTFAEKLNEEFNKLKIARQIKAVREALHISQGQLADRAGTKQPAIARLESGRVIPRLDLLHKIARAMGMKLDVNIIPADDEVGTSKKKAVRSRNG
jgi:ribosome-binding protein aMBF1 (putative translation factor)